MRQLSTANQGRCLRDTAEAAFKYLEAFTQNNAADMLAQIFGDQAAGTFRVSPLTCYENGDAVGIYTEEVTEPATEPETWVVLSPYTDRKNVYPIARPMPGGFAIIGEMVSEGGTQDQWARRAILAAAAPDLLRALEGARHQLALAAIKLEQYEQGPIRSAMKSATAAIAKATKTEVIE